MSDGLVHWQSTGGDLDIIGVSHQGLRRGNNEDNFAAAADQGIVLVADGIGGNNAGEMAAAIAIQQIYRALNEQNGGADAIAGAHQHICYHAQHNVRLKNMGATVVSAALQASQFTVHWLGDSRAYLLPHDQTQLTQLTTDHTLSEQLRQQGQPLNDAASRQYSHVLTTALGASQFQPDHIEQVSHRWQPGDLLLLCSDGLSDMVSRNQMATLLLTAPSLRLAVERLLSAALAAGGHDNVTIVVARNNGRQ
ncbi:serine/threonine-protein phosphatase [Neiella sp. HB171785]|uniref:Serine/threonine-protein phosphatase n=1 Tax=Neiella litorisoli TaxID=2771431 RepID=A0A8J6QW53_9GAMM|nr:protein phosphatase 2C domain-containing protein [Neiella litorisoli]MBD1391168.1 serine/threonine-protein phosphatase [Neiella litorisoli]